MCGVASIFSYGPAAAGVDQEELMRIREQMFKRGPDSSGTWISSDNRVGLAHRRLSIIDISKAGDQPMLDEESGNRIVFNGEIYNFRELRSHLESLGNSFHSQSDTEVLLKLYTVYGEEMLDKLRGMFAFVIWDEQKKRIFAARDPFGIKPLYVSDDGNTIRFASQVKALTAGNAVDLSSDPAGHVGFFLWGYVPEPFTLYKSIRALPAGTSLSIDYEGNKICNEYFSLNEEFSKGLILGQEVGLRTAQDCLRQALLDSISHHLITDVPKGIFLSSGLDSCSIASLAKESEEDDLRTLTLGFEEFNDTPNDEVPLAEVVGEYLGTKHQSRRISSQDFAEHYDDLLNSMDQPSIDGVNTYFICKAAREAGLKVALSGLGGDELFGGYSYFRTIPRIMSISGPFANKPSIGRSFRKFSLPFLRRITSPKVAGLLEYGGSYGGAYLLSRSHYMPWEIGGILGDTFFKDGWNDLQTLPALTNTVSSLQDDRLAISALEVEWYMRGQLLRDNDWASMAHSMEVRVPLVDIELFRSVIKLISVGFIPTKLDMARACNKPLPQSVLNKPKAGFSIPVQKWLMANDQSHKHKGDLDLKKWSETVYGSFC